VQEALLEKLEALVEEQLAQLLAGCTLAVVILLLLVKLMVEAVVGQSG
jgi:hypothetical protein